VDLSDPCWSTGYRGTILSAAITTWGIVLNNGGTLYIDDGHPTPTGIGETLRNLREIACQPCIKESASAS